MSGVLRSTLAKSFGVVALAASRRGAGRRSADVDAGVHGRASGDRARHVSGELLVLSSSGSRWAKRSAAARRRQLHEHVGTRDRRAISSTTCPRRCHRADPTLGADDYAADRGVRAAVERCDAWRAGLCASDRGHDRKHRDRPRAGRRASGGPSRWRTRPSRRRSRTGTGGAGRGQAPGGRGRVVMATTRTAAAVVAVADSGAALLRQGASRSPAR